ncbi:hypothetical protein [Brevibacillus laterosporus]|uniref:hypothetical protein n=1 Tax=Brevibacillus laterosporus TaxID=1465 RepID=UPI0018F89633|nr:hypothetical protein [Brevibacillus laterosporus]MBG9773032.1 hypothetical protein [Brevibacillus laterosporus]
MKILIEDGSTVCAETYQNKTIYLKPKSDNSWLVTKEAVVPYRNIEYIKLIADKNEVTIHENGDVTLKGDNIKFDKEISANNLS